MKKICCCVWALVVLVLMASLDLMSVQCRLLAVTHTVTQVITTDTAVAMVVMDAMDVTLHATATTADRDHTHDQAAVAAAAVLADKQFMLIHVNSIYYKVNSLSVN